MGEELIVFNRTTEKKMATAGNISFDLKSRRTRIDQAAATVMGATQGMYAHFLQIGETFFMVVDNNKEGYLLSGIHERNGLATSNIKFIRHFYRTYKIRQDKITFSLIPADGKEWQGSPMFEIFKKTTHQADYTINLDNSNHGKQNQHRNGN